jgi:peptidoglycan/LPS O-acetylase OafA/YrhL
VTYILSIGEGVFIAAAAGFVIPFIVSMFFQRENWKLFGPLLFALAIVGAVAGYAGGMSRTGVVGDIIPAFLGLLGGVGVYLFGVDKSRGVSTSFGAAALSIALILGYASGADRRKTPEDHREIRAICADAYTNAELLGNDKAFDRFEEMLGKYCNTDSTMRWWTTG